METTEWSGLGNKPVMHRCVPLRDLLDSRTDWEAKTLAPSYYCLSLSTTKLEIRAK
jgi:hypothetical protein